MASRLVPARVLEQPTRRRVFDFIKAHPGVRIGTLAGRLDLDYKTATWHVRALRRAGLLEAVGSCQARWFVRGQVGGTAAKEAVLAACTPVASVVLDHLRRSGGTRFAWMCRDLGVPKSSASKAVARLAGAGLVEKARVGGVLWVCPSPAPVVPGTSVVAEHGWRSAELVRA